MVLTATALLVRRYTGAQVVTLGHGDEPVTLDLTVDAPIRELWRALRQAPPGVTLPTRSSGSSPDLRAGTLTGLPDDLRRRPVRRPDRRCCPRSTRTRRRPTCCAWAHYERRPVPDLGAGCTAATAPRPTPYAGRRSRRVRRGGRRAPGPGGGACRRRDGRGSLPRPRRGGDRDRCGADRAGRPTDAARAGGGVVPPRGRHDHRDPRGAETTGRRTCRWTPCSRPSGWPA